MYGNSAPGRGSGIPDTGGASSGADDTGSPGVIYNKQRTGKYIVSHISNTCTTSDYEGARNLVISPLVRRLLPVEYERLQGFPDNYTRIPWRKKTAQNCTDNPRFKATGNAMAVPIIKWLGERISDHSQNCC